MNSIFLGCILATVHPSFTGHPVTVKINGITVLKAYETIAFPTAYECQEAIVNKLPSECIEFKPTDRLSVYGGEMTNQCMDGIKP